MLAADVLAAIAAHRPDAIDPADPALLGAVRDTLQAAFAGDAREERRHQVVRRLLAGELTPAQVARLGLRYPFTGVHVGLVLWQEGPGAGPVDLTSVADVLARAVGAAENLTIAEDPWTAWTWLLDESGEVDFRLSAAADDLPAGVRCAAGEPARGLEGFVRTNREAREATARAGPDDRSPGRRVVRYRDLEVDIRLGADAESARAFARAELGPLAAPDDARAARLRATLLAVFEEGGIAGAARRMGVHKNTVAYRMRRAEELLGGPVGPRRRELLAALRVLAATRD